MAETGANALMMFVMRVFLRAPATQEFLLFLFFFQFFERLRV